MSQAEDLLNSLSGEELAQYSIVLEEHIVIDNKRNITVPESLKRIAVQHDHKIETVTFDCPRYWDDNDLSTMNIYISYSRSDRVLGVYLVDNVRISDEDENIIHFDWKIGDEISTVNGKLRFSVAAKKITDENEEIRWYSEINNQMFVSEGLDGSTVIPSGHPDIINDLLSRMDTIIAADTPLLDTSLSQNGLAADAGVTGNAIKDEATKRQESDDDLRDELLVRINAVASGSPLVASSVNAMTNTKRIYVNSADGNWYYHDGSKWISGGVYQATAIGMNNINLYELSNELKEQLGKPRNYYGYGTSDTHYRIEDGKAVFNDTVASYNSKIFDVSNYNGFTIYIKAYERSDKTYGYIFVDDEFNVISYGMQGTGDYLYQSEFVKVPFGATKLLSSFILSYTNPSIITVYEPRDYRKEVNFILNNYKYKSVKLSIVDNSHYRIEDGKIVEYNNTGDYSSFVLDVHENEIYRLGFTERSPHAYGYILTDDDLNIIETGMQGMGTGNNHYEKEILIIPTGATKMFSGFVNTENDWSVEKAIFDSINDDILSNKTISVIGDSISTKTGRNACELIITEADVGVELSAYLTFNDVYGQNISLGGQTFTYYDMCDEVTFTPTSDDIGKRVGRPANYNGSNVTTWWELLEHNHNCIVNPVCWSGSSITSHETRIQRRF